MRTLLLALGLLLGGCATVVWTANAEGFRDPNHGGLKQASFDLGCPANELTAIDLGPDSVGVKGCDKKATYKYVSGTGWVANTTSE